MRGLRWAERLREGQEPWRWVGIESCRRVEATLPQATAEAIGTEAVGPLAAQVRWRVLWADCRCRQAGTFGCSHRRYPWAPSREGRGRSGVRLGEEPQVSSERRGGHIDRNLMT